MARDVWGKHPDELTQAQHAQLLEFIALAWWEMDQVKV